MTDRRSTPYESPARHYAVACIRTVSDLWR